MIRTSYRIKESPLSFKIVPFLSFLPQASMLKLIRYFIDLPTLLKTFMLVGNGDRRTLNKGTVEKGLFNHFLKWQIILKSENKHYSDDNFCFVLFSNRLRERRKASFCFCWWKHLAQYFGSLISFSINYMPRGNLLLNSKHKGRQKCTIVQWSVLSFSDFQNPDFILKCLSCFTVSFLGG